MADEDDNAPILLTYTPDETQLDDLILGAHHQNYENYQMMHGPAWTRYLDEVLFNHAIWAGAAAALVTAVGPLVMEQAQIGAGWRLPILAVATAATVFLVLYLAGRKPWKTFIRAAVQWTIAFDAAQGDREIEIGPAGVRIACRSERLELSWARYHHAIAQPKHLVLVFHGTVLAIPNDRLPAPPVEVANRINRWVAGNGEPDPRAA